MERAKLLLAKPAPSVTVYRIDRRLRRDKFIHGGISQDDRAHPDRLSPDRQLEFKASEKVEAMKIQIVMATLAATLLASGSTLAQVGGTALRRSGRRPLFPWAQARRRAHRHPARRDRDDSTGNQSGARCPPWACWAVPVRPGRRRKLLPFSMAEAWPVPDQTRVRQRAAQERAARCRRCRLHRRCRPDAPASRWAPPR